MPVRTRWSESETIRVATDIFGLAREFQPRLDRRGITVEYVAESDRLLEAARGASAGQVVSLTAQKAMTEGVEMLAARIGDRVVAIRGAIQRVFPKRKELHKAFGVGEPVDKSVSAALAAIELVEDGATSYPTETAASGILDTDVSELLALRDALRARDLTQEGAKSTKKSATATRDSLLRDLTTRVDRILAVAGLEFVNEPQTLARFQAPIPTKKRK